MRKIIKPSVAALITAGLLWQFLPTYNCCELEDKEQDAYELLLGKAIDGDPQAAEELYNQSMNNGDKATAMHWRLIGAMNGSAILSEKYVETYRSMPIEQKHQDEEIIKKSKRKGAQQLAKSLGISAPSEQMPDE